MIRKIISAVSISCLYAHVLLAADEPNVVVQQTGARTEAVVKAAESDQTAGEAKKDVLTKALSPFERGIYGTASASSYAVGKGADMTVETVQKSGGFVLSPLFRILDFRKRFEKNESGKPA